MMPYNHYNSQDTCSDTCPRGLEVDVDVGLLLCNTDDLSSCDGKVLGSSDANWHGQSGLTAATSDSPVIADAGRVRL
jgi:hypothetical protein